MAAQQKAGIDPPPSAQAWASATPAARAATLLPHVEKIGGCPFSLIELSSFDTLDKLVKAAPGLPINEQAFADALGSPSSAASSVGHVLTPAGDENASPFPLVSFEKLTLDELERARLTPRCIVPDLLYADVRIRVSAGGTGKTTLVLYEAVLAALGRPLYGRETCAPTRTAFITREDNREILAARLREIMRNLNLSPSDKAHVLEHIKIIDLSGVRFRLSTVYDDIVEPHEANIGWLMSKLMPFKPDWLIFDPLVSFGVGESRINDAEQGLVEAFRIFRNRLDCCIEGVHHSGKANAREKNLDQYSGRGGSSLADGARMVAVMQPLNDKEWEAETGERLPVGASGIVMALPKLSYAKPQESVLILRNGYAFEHVRVFKRSSEQIADATAEQVLNFIRFEFGQGRRYCNADLENTRDKLGLSRGEIRTAITALKVSGRVVYHEIKGKSGSHYEPVTLAADNGDTRSENP